MSRGGRYRDSGLHRRTRLRAEPEQAARLANYAGGIVVMKRGTATVTQAELKEAAANG